MPPDKGARNQKKKKGGGSSGMFCPVDSSPLSPPPPPPPTALLFITHNPGVSADLSCADVTEGGELQQEVVVREGHLGVGRAAVVTCGFGTTTRQGGL